MESQQICGLFIMLTWIFVIFVPSVCSGEDAPKIILDNTLFVTFKGEDLNISGTLTQPVNQTADVLKCSGPSHRQIFHCDIPTNSYPNTTLMLQLKKLNLSGDYYCQYKTAKVYWFVWVRDEGYKAPVDHTEYIMAIITGVLLLFSVVGSVYVFRGDWKEKIIKCAESSKNPGQTRKVRKEQEMEDNTAVIADQSTSFYASLEPRPGSIYHVLDRSAANGEQEQKKVKHKKKEIKQTVAQTTENKDEGVFECVYENF
ncbi:NFAT activation molecule 1 [Parambassis ranga]|uniref:NFAT activation molecule 1 n=1 Tax=Parambassis ranga TaxID=210632 RepID=A0A6P7I108_9TELE|nr:uncharacterized protein LOC114435917 [Parambassis ranga]